MGEKMWTQILLDCCPGPGRSMGCARDPHVFSHPQDPHPSPVPVPGGGQGKAPELRVPGSILPKKAGPRTRCCSDLQLQKQILHKPSLEQSSRPFLTVPLLLLRAGIQGWEHRGHSLQDQVSDLGTELHP